MWQHLIHLGVQVDGNTQFHLEQFLISNLQFSMKSQITNYKLQITNRGFTMIEMLVVIALIGILAGLALVSFSSVQKQARDTTRKSDLKQYQNALEAYANLSNGLFPSRTSSAQAHTTLCSDLNVRLEPDISCSPDPKFGGSDATLDYRYISNGTNGTATASQYVLWAKLENFSTNTYWIICSNGKTGQGTSVPSSGSCPI